MNADIIFQWSILGMALAIGGLFAAILLAAIRDTKMSVGQSLKALKAGSAYSLSGSGPPAAAAAQCYYNCMSSFHWDSEWGTSCGEACAVGTNRPKA